MKITIYSLLICSAIMLSACSNNKQQAETENTAEQPDTTLVTLTDMQRKNAGIEIGLPAKGKVNSILNLQGAIDVPPQSTVSVSFPLGGYLKSTDLLPGVHVRKGQVLGVLEDMQFIQLQQDYLSAKERFIYSETEFKRQQELNAAKASSDKVFQQARTEMQTQRVLMGSLAQKLELLGLNPRRLSAANISKSVNILSPIDGFVSKVNVNIGKYTSPTDVLFELVNPRDIHLGLNVFEKDVSKLAIGQKVIAYTNSEPGKRYEAEIILISKNLNADRMAEVHCHFEKFDPALLPGMFMNAEVEIDNQEALTVPEDAIVRWQDKFYVFTATNNSTFKITPVTTGEVFEGRRQISSNSIGIATQLVTKNAYTLLMKLKNSADED